MSTIGRGALQNRMMYRRRLTEFRQSIIYMIYRQHRLQQSDILCLPPLITVNKQQLWQSDHFQAIVMTEAQGIMWVMTKITKQVFPNRHFWYR